MDKAIEGRDYRIGRTGGWSGTGDEALILKGPWRTELGPIMRRRRIKYLVASAYEGWHERSISFLGDIPEIESLDVDPARPVDPAPLYELPRLRELSLGAGVKGQVDFTRMGKLENLGLGFWDHKRTASVFGCRRLKILNVFNYSGSDLRDFAGLANLEILGFNGGKLRNLNNGSQLGRLVKLDLMLTHQVVSLEGIEGLSGLVELAVERAKRLRFLDGLGQLKRLRILVLSFCPAISSLRPLQGATALEGIALMHDTKIEDGDLSVLDDLPRLQHASFVDRKSYNRRSAQFPKAPMLFHG